MKKAFLIALCLVVAGIAMIAVAAHSQSFDFSKLINAEYVTNRHSVPSTFTSIAVDVDTADVVFDHAMSGDCIVECLERDTLIHSVYVEDNTLHVKLEDNRKWYEKIVLFSFKSPKITIYLPLNNYEKLSAKSDTGDIVVPDNLRFDNAVLDSDTGDIEFNADVVSSLKIDNDTGDIAIGNRSVDNLNLGGLNVSADTGNIDIDCVNAGDVRLETDTGNIKLKVGRCSALIAESDTGNVKITDFIADGKMTIDVDTGNVLFTNADAAELEIETHTGDVEGTLLTPKIFYAHSQTGHVHTPESLVGGRCKITSDTGDIDIRINSTVAHN